MKTETINVICWWIVIIILTLASVICGVLGRNDPGITFFVIAALMFVFTNPAWRDQ